MITLEQVTKTQKGEQMYSCTPMFIGRCIILIVE